MFFFSLFLQETLMLRTLQVSRLVQSAEAMSLGDENSLDDEKFEVANTK